MTNALQFADALKLSTTVGGDGTIRDAARPPASFAQMLGSALDGAASAVAAADGTAGALAAGRASVGDAVVARAKADTMLEVLAVAAARVGGAVSTLMQTQI